MKRFLVPSSSSQRTHIVAQYDYEDFACSCIGWTRHYPRRNCKHIKQVIAKALAPASESEINALKLQDKNMQKAIEILARMEMSL